MKINYEPLINELKRAGITVVRYGNGKEDVVFCNIGKLHSFLQEREASQGKKKELHE